MISHIDNRGYDRWYSCLSPYLYKAGNGWQKQTAGVELVVVLVFGIKAADMYVSQGMDEAFVAQVDADVRDAFFAVDCGFATEKDEVSALHVGEIRSDFNAFAYISLLRRISRDDYIVHKSTVRTRPLQSTPFEEVPAHR